VSAKTPIITLGEGGTPLIPAPALSARTGAKVFIKYEGMNPTGSFKDRGMTMAISKAVEHGAKAVICASTGNTSASAAAYAAHAGITAAVLVPEGKISMGKLSQAVSSLLPLDAAGQPVARARERLGHGRVLVEQARVRGERRADVARPKDPERGPRVGPREKRRHSTSTAHAQVAHQVSLDRARALAARQEHLARYAHHQVLKRAPADRAGGPVGRDDHERARELRRRAASVRDDRDDKGRAPRGPRGCGLKRVVGVQACVARVHGGRLGPRVREDKSRVRSFLEPPASRTVSRDFFGDSRGLRRSRAMLSALWVRGRV
jgi:hypothetical protein